jgi:hypothetical protein
MKMKLDKYKSTELKLPPEECVHMFSKTMSLLEESAYVKIQEGIVVGLLRPSYEIHLDYTVTGNAVLMIKIKAAEEGIGPKRFFGDFISIFENGNTAITQHIFHYCILRFIGQSIDSIHCCSVGVPIALMFPFLKSLGIEGSTNGIKVDHGYFWLPASWGTNTTNAKFRYCTKRGSDESLQMVKIFDQNKAHTLLGGNSSLGVGMFSVTVSIGSKVINGNIVPDLSDLNLSLKLHEWIHYSRR